jgi:arginase family enzyme
MAEMDRHGVRDLNAPWYAGSPSFARAPIVDPGAVPQGDVAVIGLPIDEYATSSQRSGMRWGPRRIREASLRWVRYYGTETDAGILDIRGGRVTNWPERMPIVDAGDAPVIHHDVHGQIEAARDYIGSASRTSSVTVTLGGDHFVAYPAADGVISAWRERQPNLRVGFLHIDSHTDFVDDRLGQGKYNHGTCVRRIAEIPEVRRIAWFGLNGTSEPNQFQLMKERGFRAFTSFYTHRVGPEKSMSDALDYVLDGVDILYVSIDIDVVNNAHAPATGSSVFEGLSGHEFMDAMRTLATADALAGIDMCEVDPDIDGSWRTELLASSALLTVLGRRLYREVDVIPRDELREVFLV